MTANRARIVPPLVLAIGLTTIAACSPDDLAAPSGPINASTSTREGELGRTVVRNEYIVVLREPAGRVDEFLRQNPLRTLPTDERWSPNPDTVLLSRDEGLLATFSIINGFAARLTAATVEKMRADPRVASIEENEVVRLSGAGTQSNAPWHLDRIDQRDGFDGNYTWSSDGSVGSSGRVKIYVIDSGIETAHAEFGGRASQGYSYYGTSGDCNGHGTAVAGIAAGQTYGVAKGAAVVSVRITPTCTAITNSAALVAGMDWVRLNRVGSSVANLSIALGNISGAVFTALSNLASSGVTPVVAVGDNASLACNYSPGNSAFAIKVGSTDVNGTIASTNNYGSCLDVFAPGQNVTSAGLYGGTSTNSGTSFSAALVSGIAARYLNDFPTVAWHTVKNYIVSNASPDRVGGIPPVSG